MQARDGTKSCSSIPLPGAAGAAGLQGFRNQLSYFMGADIYKQLRDEVTVIREQRKLVADVDLDSSCLGC